VEKNTFIKLLINQICQGAAPIVCFSFDCCAICANFVDTVYGLKVPPVFPLHKRHTRLHLPCSGSLGPRFPTFPQPFARQHRYYAQLRLPLSLPFGSLIAPYRYLPPTLFYFVSLPQLIARIGSPISRRGHLLAPGLLVRRHPLSSGSLCKRRQEALPSSRTTPLNTCPVLRPRWCPCCFAIAQPGLLPSSASNPSAFTAHHGLSY
jgi:hypothetical protein